MCKVVLSLILMVFLQSLVGCSVDPIAAANNCGIQSPPSESGEDLTHETLLKIFPRKFRISGNYSGCQTVWIDDSGQWKVVMVGVFENGELVAMRVPSRPGDPIEQCRKRAGILVRGDSNVCSAMDAFPYASVAPACLSSAKTRADANCSYD
jgi:hypothetical protein